MNRDTIVVGASGASGMLSMSTDSECSPTSRAMLRMMAGVKARPPRRGTIPLCTLRASTTSNNLFLKEIRMICGIINAVITALSKKARPT